MTSEFLNRLHAGYNTPEQIIFDLVKQATGQKAESREKIVRGYDSEVYRVTTRQREDFVVRIHHHGGNAFAEEAWAIEQCRRGGIPAPEVLLVQAIAIAGQPHEVMVQRAVPGRALCDMQGDLTLNELEAIWRQAGAALSAMHNIKVGGFYRRHSDGRWDFPDWAGIAQSALTNRAAEKPLLIQAGFTEQEVDLMLALIEYGQRTYPCDQPVLCHGDFAPEHLFVDQDLNLSGVIDFGEFQGGAPILDFAILSMYIPELDLTWLQRGYLNQQLFDDTFSRRLLLAKVGLQIGYLAHYIRQANADEAGPIAKGLRETLREWRNMSK